MDTPPVYTRSQLVDYVKHMTLIAQRIGVDRLVKNDHSRKERTSAVAIADYIAYAMDTQSWINAKDEPLLDEIWGYAVDVDNDYTNKEAWIKLLELVEELK